MNLDNILTAIARELTSDNQIEALAKALDIELPDIQRCLQTNQKGPDVTGRGTLAMLRDWRQTVTEEKERVLLRTALLEARLTRMAGKYLPPGAHIIVYQTSTKNILKKIKVTCLISDIASF